MSDPQTHPKHACPVCGRMPAYNHQFCYWYCQHQNGGFAIIKGDADDLSGAKWDAMIEGMLSLPGTFEWACDRIMEGEKVRRVSWQSGVYAAQGRNVEWFYMCQDEKPMCEFSLTKDVMSATDWEVLHG